MKVMLLNAPSALLPPLADQDIELVVLDDARRLKGYAAELDSKITVVPHRTESKIDLRAIWNLQKLIRSHRPDIIHAFWGKSLANAVVASMAQRYRPRIISYRGIQTVPSPWDPSNYLTFLSRRVQFHACESNAVRDGLIGGGIAPEKCHTVYNCISTARMRQLKRRGPLWRSLNIPRRAFVIGTVATIRPVKGIDLLLEAALRCLDLPNTYWLLIGPVEDPRVAELANDPRLRDRIRMTGFNRRASDIISGADLFVMPSRQEALCRALLEAMTMEVCPVVSAAGGMKELVRHEQDGLVFPIEDVAAIEASIRQLHADRDLVRHYATSAAQRVSDMCSPERMCERTLEIYRRAA